jgi:hypothetical protein
MRPLLQALNHSAVASDTLGLLSILFTNLQNKTHSVAFSPQANYID